MNAAELSEQAQSTLARLMPHIHRRPDLPGLARATLQVQRTARRENARVQTLVEAVAADPGLSARLLRLSNSAVHASAGAGRNASLERAVRLLGFATVQQLAAGLPLIDRLREGAASRLLREDFLRALLAAPLARELSGDWRDTDAAQLAATFQNLGRMLVATHLPDEARAIRAAVPRNRWPLAEREQRAARRRLGWRYADLGLHVARHWGWPEAVRGTLPHHDDWPLHRPQDARGRQRLLARLANELADLMLYVDPKQWPAACQALQPLVRGGTGHDAESLRQALARVHPRLEPLAELVELPRSERAEWQAADVVMEAVDEAHDAHDAHGAQERQEGHGARDPQVVPAMPAPTPPEPSAAPAAAPAPPAVPARLQPDEQVLQQLHLALSAQRAVLWRATSDGSPYALQQVLGQPLPAELGALWSIDPLLGQDLFSRLCRHGHDALIRDAREPRIARHLPEAFRRGVDPGSFLVLPLRRGGQPHGLLYLDRPDERPFTLDGDAMQLVRTVRDQATRDWV